MNYDELQNALEIARGKLTISHNTLTSNIGSFLTAYYADQPLVITGADIVAGADEGKTATVTGTASVLDATDLPVTATFWIDDQGDAQMRIKYRLRGETARPDDWVFSRSFPRLPVTINYQTIPESAGRDPSWMESQIPFLDGLSLYNTYFVFSTRADDEPEFGVPLAAGINFVSNMKPQNTLGILEHSLGDGADLVLFGTIVLPTSTRRTKPLEPLERIWNRDEVPGIRLQAALAVDVELGNMSFDRASFRVYSPPSEDWADANTSFKAVHGYTGMLRIPSADIEIDLDSELHWGVAEAELRGYCKGITLGKMTALLDLGGANLESHLPKPLQKAAAKLDRLALTYVSVDLAMSDNLPRVRGLCFTIGMPDLSWKPVGDVFLIERIMCRFEIANPLGPGKPQVSVLLYGTVEIEGVTLFIMASTGGGFTLYAFLGDGQVVPLEKLLKRYAPGIPAPGDLTVDDMSLIIAPGKYYAMTANVASEPNPWVIPVGPGSLEVRDVSFGITKPQKGPISGYFAGAIDFAEGLGLAINYDVPGNIVLRGDFPRVKLSQLVGTLCNQKVALPRGFDLTFEHSSVIIQKIGPSYVFQAATQMKKLGTFAFEVRRVGAGKWGFAAGLDLGAGRLSELPGLAALDLLEGAFTLQKFLLVVASYDNADFQFPGLAQFKNPRITSRQVALPAQAAGVVAGLSIFAEWKLDTGKPQQKLLKKLLGLSPTLDVAIQVGANPAKNCKLAVGYRTSIGGHPLTCQFGAMIQDGKVGLYLTGTMTVKIQKKPQTFDVAMMFVTGGAFISGSIQGTVEFGHLQLSNVGMVIGINWAGIFSLGLTANLSVGSFNSSLAVFFDSTDPSKSLLAGAVSELTLRDVAVSLAGKVPGKIGEVLDKIAIEGTGRFTMPMSVSGALDNAELGDIAAAFKEHGKVTIPTVQSKVLLTVQKPGNAWNLTNLADTMRHYEIKKERGKLAVYVQPQFYFAPRATAIGALRFAPGYALSGVLNIFGLKLITDIDINPNKGVIIDAAIDKPVVIYKKEFFKLGDSAGRKGPRVSIASYSRPDHEVKAFRRPHAYMSGRLAVLGVETLDCFVSITVDGAEFYFKQSSAITPRGKSLSGTVAQSFTIRGTAGAKRLAAGVGVTAVVEGKVALGKLGVGKKGLDAGLLKDLGTITLKLEVTGDVDVSFDGRKARATFAGSFRFQNQGFSFSKTLSVDSASLARIGEVAYEAVEDELRELLKVAEKWAQWVDKGIIAGVKDVGQMANAVAKIYGKSARDTARALRSAGKSVDQVGDALKSALGLKRKAAENALKGAGFPVRSVEKYLDSAYGAVVKEAEQAAKTATRATKKTTEKAAKTTKKAAKKATKGLKKLGKKKKKKKKKRK